MCQKCVTVNQLEPQSSCVYGLICLLSSFFPCLESLFFYISFLVALVGYSGNRDL